MTHVALGDFEFPAALRGPKDALVGATWERVVRGAAWTALRGYYRSFRVEGAERVPAQGPVLLVANHPNSLLDPAALIVACPRPIRFGAKRPLFAVPVLGAILRGIGAVPIDRPGDAGSAVRGNTQALAQLGDVLRQGGVSALFPEGRTHETPKLDTLRSGPARVALDAEEASGWSLGVQVVPVGLTFHPRQAFRGEAVVRIGRPFRVDDLLDVHRHQAIRTVQERMTEALRPLVHHIDRVELAPLVQRVAELYDDSRRAASAERKLSREEIERIAGACLNHWLVADPEAVDQVRRDVARHDRLCGRMGLPDDAVDLRQHPARSILRLAGATLAMALGSPLFAVGALTGLLPYRLTDLAARRSQGTDTQAVLPFFRVLWGAVFFGAFWGAIVALYWQWSRSALFAAVLAAALVGCGLFARAYAGWARAWRERATAVLPLVFQRRALARAARLRSEILVRVMELAKRWQEGTGTPLFPAETIFPRPRRRRRWLRAAAVLVVGAAVWFSLGFRGTAMDRLGNVESPWRSLPAEEARFAVDRDARELTGLLDALAGIEVESDHLRADFAAGRRDFYDPATEAALRRALCGYLTCRERLYRLAWTYKDPTRQGDDALSTQAFLLAYASAVELCSRGMQFVDTFDAFPDAVAKLNQGEPAWGIPPGVYDDVRRNLADRDLYDTLADASRRFADARAGGACPAEAPWPRIVESAARGEQVVASLSDRLWTYKWDAAVARARENVDRGRYDVSSAISTWIGDTRLRERPQANGLVSPAQLAELATRLQPGDIVLERRNWYLSNAFLPGYWPHSAVWLGGVEGLEALGVADDPAVRPHLAALREPDERGHARRVIEAISEGAVFTSIEESLGGADALCVLRPRLPREQLQRAVVRAVAQHGKPYDFDFDFFSTDKVVCTEVVFQAYQEPIGFELVEVMGRRTLPALQILRRWERERDTPDARLELVAFLDADEEAGCAIAGDGDRLCTTLDRAGTTLLHTNAAGKPLLLSPTLIALAAMTAAAFLLRPRRT